MNKTKGSGETISRRGFTLIEILIVIGMLAILATVVLVAINPLRQFAQARNSQREANVSAILNAVSNRIADNRGIFAVEGEESGCKLLTGEIDYIAKSSSESPYHDLRPCLVPDYISELPFDPEDGNNTCGTDRSCSSGTYDTKYTIQQHASTSRITICAPNAEEDALPNSKPFCLTR